MKPRTMNLAPPVSPKNDRQESQQAKPKRFTIADYHRLTDLGFLLEGDRIELIRGELFEMAAQGTPHTFTTTRLCRQLDRLLGDSVSIRGQMPITLPSESEPEPDVVIARGHDRNYGPHHPYPEDILLIIEVTDSALEQDRTLKLSVYAEANIQHYWIANVKVNQMECHSQPYEDRSGNFAYQTRTVILNNQRVSIPGSPEIHLNLAEIFL